MSEVNVNKEGPVTVSKTIDSDIMAKTSVTNDHGENLGKVESLMLDLETGRIAYIVISFGGFPNRTKYFAVPYELLTFSHHDKKLILNIPRDLMVNAPGYASVEQVMQSSDFSWLGDVFEYYSHKNEWDVKREEVRKAELQQAKQRREEAGRTKPPSTT